MKKLFLVLMVAMINVGCASPTPPPTPTAAPTPTTANAPIPANTPTPANTATPAPTATPAATATPVCAGSEVNNLTVMPLFTSNSKHIVLGTGCGVEVFEAQTLKPVANYGGLVLATVLPDGRFAARAGGNVVFVDPATGKMDSTKTKVDFAGTVAVSPAGTLMAKLVDAKTVRLFDLNSDKTTDLVLQAQTTEAPRYIKFSPNGALLAVGFVDDLNSFKIPNHANALGVYEVSSGKKLHETNFSGAPYFSPDSKYLYPTNTFINRNLYDATTGKVISRFANPLLNCDRGVGVCGTAADGAGIVEDRFEVVSFFVVGGLETVLTFWEHTISWVPPGVVVTEQNFSTAYKHIRSQEIYVEDFVSNKRKFAFLTGGLTAEDFAYGTGASDGSVFLLIKTSGSFALYSAKDGKALASLDRFTLK